MMNRRDFLAAGALALAASPSVSRAAGPRRHGHVTSDIAPLRRVLVHEPGPETRKAMMIAGVDHPLQSIELIGPEATTQHRRLVALLREGGAEVVVFKDVLASAIEAARRADAFGGWLQAAAPQLVDREAEIDADALLGARDDLVYHDPGDGQSIRPLTYPLKFLLYVRDLAVMTPRGLVLSNFINRNRQFEIELLRFALKWSEALRDYPIAFDATRERLPLQGGDMIVLDGKTLLVGVGNLTAEPAARRLAQRLNMDVLAVHLPSGRRFRGEGPFGQGNGLRLSFLHLDSIFNLTGERSALTLPYFLESAYTGQDPLTLMLRGLGEQPGVDRDYMDRLAASLANVGHVRRYKAGTGELDASLGNQKLVDVLRDRGFSITYIGGDPPDREGAKHVVERVLHEVRFQAGNIVALAPGRLLACMENTHTLAALRRDGNQVATFPASELVRWHGGAHCLTLPLERGT